MKVAKQARRVAKEKYGGRKGALSLVVEDALRQVISPPEISISTLSEVVDYVSRASKDKQSKNQILTNVFLMLDQEFEQSIIRGMDDTKKGRCRVVPRSDDPIQFLRKLARHSSRAA